MSALSMKTGLTENSIKCLEPRYQRLKNREKIGSLFFGEIYTAIHCEYSQSNGQIYCISNELPSKTLLSVMFKSIASSMRM